MICAFFYIPDIVFKYPRLRSAKIHGQWVSQSYSQCSCIMADLFNCFLVPSSCVLLSTKKMEKSVRNGEVTSSYCCINEFTHSKLSTCHSIGKLAFQEKRNWDSQIFFHFFVYKTYTHSLYQKKIDIMKQSRKMRVHKKISASRCNSIELHLTIV